LRPYRDGTSNVANFVDLYLANTFPSGWRYRTFDSSFNITAFGPSLEVRDCIFGAKAPGAGSIGDGNRGYNVRAAGDLDLLLRGIYLLGNTRVEALPQAVDAGIVFEIPSLIFGCKNTQDFIGSRVVAGRSVRLAVSFAWRHGANPVGSSRDRNFDVNCVHILDDNGNYGLMANRTATDGTRGASVANIIGEMNTGSFVYTGGFNSWQTGFTNANKHHGFAGTFGNINSGSEGPIGISTTLGPISFYRFDSYTNAVWQTATTATAITSNVSLSPAPGTNEFSYDSSNSNALNIRTRAFYRGIDVNTAQLVGGALQSNRFFG
jgi:hypothetical protein